MKGSMMKPRVLLVDDAEEFTQYTSRRLKARGFNVTTVSCGLSALDAIKEHDFDVVVLDILMPGIDGMETLAKIKEYNTKIQVIMLTGHGSDESSNLGKDLGAFEYLLKPTDFSTLLDTIQRAFAYKLDSDKR